MKIKSQHSGKLVLAGTPGGAVWMVVMVVIGIAITAAVVWFGTVLWHESESGWDPTMIPLSVGALIGQALLWTGAVTLAVGRVSLTLDQVTGRGTYLVVSPIVTAGKPCEFSLKNVRSVTVETFNEDRPSHELGGATEATVHRAVLRLTKPRRSIVLDETENNRVERVDEIARAVAEFLGNSVERESAKKT